MAEQLLSDLIAKRPRGTKAAMMYGPRATCVRDCLDVAGSDVRQSARVTSPARIRIQRLNRLIKG
jgi:hypothetical protein